MILRPYQTEISIRGAEILRKHKIVYLAMQVRTGKTITALEIARLVNAKNILFITKKKAILSIESDAKNFDMCIDVINYESVAKMTGKYDLIIIDEAHSCFIGDTPIGGVKIKDIKIGSTQKSFNFVKGIYEEKKVLNVFKNQLLENLVKIKCNGKEIVCTESHKIFTKRGWIEARNILPSDELHIL